MISDEARKRQGGAPAPRTPVRIGSTLDRFVAEHYCVTEVEFQGRVEICGHHVLAHDKKTGGCLGTHRRGSCLCSQLKLAAKDGR